jgi:hypothetical protein
MHGATFTTNVVVELAGSAEVEVESKSCCVESHPGLPAATNILYDAKLIGAVHWVPFVIVNDAVPLALFTLTLPTVIVPLFTSVSNWPAEREQGTGGHGSTQMETLELSFAVFRSVSPYSATVAVFVTVVLAMTVFAVAVIVRVALCPLDNVPMPQLPVELE